MKTASKAKKILWRYLAIYLVAFICLLAMLLPGYLLFENALCENAAHTSQLVLNEGIQRLESELNSTLTALHTLSESYKIRTLSYMDPAFQSQDVTAVREGLTLYEQIISPLTLPQQTGIYLKNDLIIHNGQLYKSTKEFSNFFTVSGINNFASLLDIFRQHGGAFVFWPAQVSYQDSMLSEVFFFAASLPLETKWSGTIGYSILDTEAVASSLALPDTLQHARLRLYDAAGTLLVDTTGSAAQNQLVSISAYSSNYGLYAELDIEYSHIINQLSTYLRLMLLFFAAYIVFGGVLLVVLARRNLRPLVTALDGAQNIYAEMQRSTPQDERTATDYLSTFLQYVRNTLRENQALIKRQRDSLASSTFELLLHEDTAFSVDGRTSDLLIELPPKWRMVVIRILHSDDISPDDYSQLQLFLLSVLHTLPDISLHHFTLDMLVVIVSAGAGRACIDGLIHQIGDALLSQMQLEIQSAVSSLHEGILALCEAFAALRTRLRMLGSELPMPPYYEEDSPHHIEVLEAEYSSGTQLYDALMRGDTQLACDRINGMAAVLREHSQPSETDVQQFFFLCRHALNCAQRALNEADFVCPTYKKHTDVGQLCARLTESAVQLCNRARQQLLDNANSFDRSVLAWIDANTSDSSLCVQKVGEQFSLSATTLQRVMHRSVGKSFLEYVDEMRMSKACTLLETTDLPVKEIALQCGYTSFNTFYKAFRRRYQTTPSSMRSSIEDTNRR